MVKKKIVGSRSPSINGSAITSDNIKVCLGLAEDFVLESQRSVPPISNNVMLKGEIDQC